MTVTQIVMGLGSWEVALTEETPDDVLTQLGFFGHLAVIDGQVDVVRTGDGLLTGARYVGVTREKDTRTGRVLGGSGMTYWLGDEDGKGHLIESELNLTGKTFVQAVTAVLALCPSVVLGSVEVRPGVMPADSLYQFQTPREVLTIVCEAFGSEFRVNGNGSVDAGTPAFLYNTEAPDTIIVRKGAGSDLDLTALGGNFEVQKTVYDFTTRALLLGSTLVGEETELFATGSADAPSVPYLDLFGHPVKSTRAISESGTPVGSVASRAQLQLNRFNRVARSLKLDADEFDTEGNFVVGDNVYVYDPDTETVNPAIQVLFQGQVWHPESIRSTGMTWPIVAGYTVAFRTQAGVWLDLTPFVVWETSGTDVTVGDLPKTLSSGGESIIQTRVDGARSATGTDTTVPNAPTGLAVATFSGLNSLGQTVSVLSPSWTAPGLNTDASAITDLSHYIVQYRWTARTVWQQVLVADATSVEVTVAANLPYEVRVAAVDLAGHLSAWSSSVTLTSAKDAVAPPAPADPVVTSYLGQLRIEYLGVSAAATAMPSDTNRVDVHVGTTSAFTFTDATRVASLSPFGKGVAYATVPYSLTDNRWVRLVAYDHTGNVSASSAAIGGHTVQVADGDIASLNVGKLVSGIISADVVVAGNVLTALTGQRSGMTALGFQAWDASNNQTILLNGVANLLTGTLQTALTGNRRVVIGASGNVGRIQFFAPDGTLTEIGSFTGVGTVGAEALRIGVVYPTLSGQWGKTQHQNDGNTFSWHDNHKIVVGGSASSGFFRIHWASSKGTVGAPTIPDESRFAVLAGGIYVDAPTDGIFQVSYRIDSDTNVARMTVAPTNFTFRAVAPNDQRITMNTEEGRNDTSLSMGFVHSGGFGTRLWHRSVNSSGASSRFEVLNIVASGYENLWAASFVVSSSIETKEDVRSLEAGALAKVRQLRTVRYKRKGQEGLHGRQAPASEEQIGLIAEETAAAVPDITQGDGKLIDVMATLSLLIAAVQELDERGKK